MAERSSPLGVITVVESPLVPFRHAPGLSLNAPGEPPAQLGVFVDGDGPSALLRYDGRREPLAYLDYLTSALPYHLLAHPRVLVLGAGAGADVLQAIAAARASVDAVELNPQMIDLVERDFADFSGRPYSATGVRVHVAEARGFVARHRGRFDLIEVALLDAFGASSAGLYALSESYLYTVEALEAYLDRLEPGGMLAITRWIDLPPRDVLKLFGTAAAALERRGVAAPGRQLALVRSWKTVTLLVKNGAFTPAEIAALEEFCRERSFDADYYPGMRPEQANRYNVLDASYFHDGALALLGPEREAFVERYKFAIAPATDDRPHFFHFFRWRTLPELLALKSAGRPAAARMGLSGADRHAAAGDAREPAADRAAALDRRRGCRDRPAGAIARGRRALLRRDRLRVHVHRDRIHPEVHPVPRASALRGGGRPLRVPGVRRTGKPLFAALAAAEAAAVPSAGLARCRDRRHRARLPGRAAGDLPAPDAAARPRADRDRDGADRAAGVRDGDAVSAGARPPRRPRRGADAVGVGHQRLRVGDRGDSRHGARDPPRVRRGDRARGRAVRVAAAAWPAIRAR